MVRGPESEKLTGPAKQLREEALSEMLSSAERWTFRLWQVARSKPPEGESKEKAAQFKVSRAKTEHALQVAADQFKKKHGRCPEGLAELLREKFITEIPIEPGGGEFHLEPIVRIMYRNPTEPGTERQAQDE